MNFSDSLVLVLATKNHFKPLNTPPLNRTLHIFRASLLEIQKLPTQNQHGGVEVTRMQSVMILTVND